MPNLYDTIVTQELISSLVQAQIAIGNLLPSVQDDQLRKIIRAPNFLVKPHELSETEAEAEVIETLGDWILTYELGRTFVQAKPGIRSGLLTELRHCITNNRTFACLAQAYCLETEVSTTIPSGRRRTKALADIFEMRMGALCQENREAEVRRWCSTVGLAILEAVYEDVERLHKDHIRQHRLGGAHHIKKAGTTACSLASTRAYCPTSSDQPSVKRTRLD